MKASLKGVRSILLTFGIGLGMGVVYWALHTESPAPALIGLAGLAGIVVGEKALHLVLARVARRCRRSR
jgi:XapX domain-containing protein